MGIVYQLTFFLALGLLTIVITIFVFAVSLLGRAMEAAARSENEKLAERKENNAKEMTAMKKEIEKAEASGQIPRGMIRRLKKLEERDKKFDKELSKIRRAPELLTVKSGVLPVGSCLLAALILSGAAWYLSNGQVFSWIIPVLIWILGLAAIGYSIYGIYRCLRVIESVAITSEEAALKRTVEAFKIAEKELEEEKKPELALAFEDKQPPFHVEAEAETSLTINIRLSSGDVARKPEVIFVAPPDFEFLNMPKGPRIDQRSKYTDYISAAYEFEDIRKGLSRWRRFEFKTPSQPGNYKCAYRIFCEGFDSGYEEFEVVVK
ncbi:hypothetical protein ES707_02424 [subsurface metagenome]